HLRRKLDGRLIAGAEIFREMGKLHPHAIEEAIRRLVSDAFDNYDLIIVDDFWMFERVSAETMSYPRPFLVNLLEEAMFDKARDLGKHLVLTRDSTMMSHQWNEYHVRAQSVEVQVPDFTA